MAGRKQGRGRGSFRDGAFPFLPPPVFDAEAMRWSARRLRSALIDAAARVADRIPPPPFVASPLALGCFGPDRPGHPLRHPPLYVGFTPHESQATRALAHMLAGNAARMRGFITALFAACGRSVPPELDLAALDRRAVAVAKHRFQRRSRARRNRDRRIDVLVRWTGCDGAKRGVIVETKFGHHTTPDQLPAMREFALKTFGSLERAALFVIGLAPDHRAERNRDWTKVRWSTVLRRWETVLAEQDDDTDFARFRSALWNRCR